MKPHLIQQLAKQVQKMLWQMTITMQTKWAFAGNCYLVISMYKRQRKLYKAEKSLNKV